MRIWGGLGILKILGGGVKSQISKFQIPNFFLNQVWTGSNFYGRRKVPKKIPAKICVFWNLEFEPAQKFETGGVTPCFKLLGWNAGPGSNSKFGTSLDVPNLEFEPKKNEFGTLRRHPICKHEKSIQTLNLSDWYS